MKSFSLKRTFPVVIPLGLIVLVVLIFLRVYFSGPTVNNGKGNSFSGTSLVDREGRLVHLMQEEMGHSFILLSSGEKREVPFGGRVIPGGKGVPFIQYDEDSARLFPIVDRAVDLGTGKIAQIKESQGSATAVVVSRPNGFTDVIVLDGLERNWEYSLPRGEEIRNVAVSGKGDFFVLGKTSVNGLDSLEIIEQAKQAAGGLVRQSIALGGTLKSLDLVSDEVMVVETGRGVEIFTQEGPYGRFSSRPGCEAIDSRLGSKLLDCDTFFCMVVPRPLKKGECSVVEAALELRRKDNCALIGEIPVKKTPGTTKFVLGEDDEGLIVALEDPIEKTTVEVPIAAGILSLKVGDPIKSHYDYNLKRSREKKKAGAVVWPLRETMRDILHIRGTPHMALKERIHEGIDIRVPSPRERVSAVYAARGGVVKAVGKEDIVIDVGEEVDEYRHVALCDWLVAGDKVEAGSWLGSVMEDPEFGFSHLEWNSTRNPLRLFEDAEDRDPWGRKPRVGDVDKDGSDFLTLSREGSVRSPACGEVEMVVDAFDLMGSDDSYKVSPAAIGYWVESVSPPNISIASESHPNLFWLDSGTDSEVAGLVDFKRPVEFWAPRWPVYLSWVVTRVVGEGVDVNWVWKTDAVIFGGSVDGGSAVYPDGVYRVHVLVGDLFYVGGRLETFERLVVVDNFFPAIRELEILRGGEVICRMELGPGGGEVPCGGEYSSGLVDVRVLFSEPVRSLVVVSDTNRKLRCVAVREEIRDASREFLCSNWYIQGSKDAIELNISAEDLGGSGLKSDMKRKECQGSFETQAIGSGVTLKLPPTEGDE